ncbi:MAG: hypothetical protein NT154_38595, partial [Verrucomicrobia bacterium]|nr:hypothetical protein [Verrucomicrobiota bacterium]
MYLIRKYDRCITGLISSDTKRSFLIAATALAVLLLAIGGLLAWIGAPPMNGRPWDAAIVLDGAWRVANGQVPHRDFYSFVGSFPWYLASLGMKLSHPCLSAIVYGDILLMAALCSTAMAVFCRRTSALYALLFSLFLGVLVVSPRPLGDPFDYIDYAMSYNRFGEAFLGLFSVLVFLSPRSGDRRGLIGLVEAALMGLLLTLLWFVKLNYFAIGALFFGIGVALRFIDLRSAVVCGLSALGFLGLALALTGIPLGAMVGDFRIMSGAQDFRGKIEMLSMRSFENAWRLPVLLILTWESISGKQEVRYGWPYKWQEWVLPLAVFGSALLLIASNT